LVILVALNVIAVTIKQILVNQFVLLVNLVAFPLLVHKCVIFVLKVTIKQTLDNLFALFVLLVNFQKATATLFVPIAPLGNLPTLLDRADVVHVLLENMRLLVHHLASYVMSVLTLQLVHILVFYVLLVNSKLIKDSLLVKNVLLVKYPSLKALANVFYVIRDYIKILLVKHLV
jgi:hypothetical protein